MAILCMVAFVTVQKIVKLAIGDGWALWAYENLAYLAVWWFIYDWIIDPKPAPATSAPVQGGEA